MPLLPGATRCPAYPSPDRVTAAASCRGSSPVVPVLSTAEIATKDARQSFGDIRIGRSSTARQTLPPVVQDPLLYGRDRPPFPVASASKSEHREQSRKDTSPGLIGAVYLRAGSLSADPKLRMPV